jgi:hypothetical protein
MKNEFIEVEEYGADIGVVDVAEIAAVYPHPTKPGGGLIALKNSSTTIPISSDAFVGLKRELLPEKEKKE